MPRTIVFHHGALGDVVLIWPLLGALRAAGHEVVFISDGEKARLTAAELGVAGVDIEQPRFNALWSGDGPVVGEADVDLVISTLAPRESVWARRTAAMFPRARLDFVEARLDRRAALALAARYGPGVQMPQGAVGARAAGAGVSGAGPVVLHVGAGSADKRWPMDRWVALAAGLAQRVGGIPVQLIAGEVEAERFTAGERAMFDAGGGRFLSGLAVLADTIKRARAFIAADSGPGHLAAQLGVPVLTLFGPTDPGLWAPIGPRARVLAPLGVSPMTWLDPQRVLGAVSAMLDESSNGRVQT